jgi:hypothetical protein
MSNGSVSVETAIGNVAIISERSVTRQTQKLDSVSIGSPESYYMLAAFCFDLSRKVNYLFQATRDFASQADPALARLMMDDNNAINEDGLTWEQRARIAEQIMLRSVAELGNQHEQALRAAAERHQGS